MVFSGNVISSGDTYNYEGQFVRSEDGRAIFRAVGAGIITDTFQTSIPVWIYPPRNKELASTFPNRNIVIPSGAQIISASLRLPSARIRGDQIRWGAQLPIGTLIVGSTAETLKVNFGSADQFSKTATASISTVNGQYPLGASSRITRNPNAADNANGILNTLTSQRTVRLMVDSDDGSSVSGIKLSTADKAVIAVDIYWAVAADAVRFNELPNLTENFYIRG